MTPLSHGLEQPDEQPTDEELEHIRTVAHNAARGAGAVPADADDVAQILTTKLWQKWNEPHIRRARRRTLSSWSGYVARAAVNTWIDLYRSDQRRGKRETTFITPVVPARVPLRPGSTRHPSTTRSADDDIDDFLVRLELAQVFDEELTGRQRLVMRRIYIHGWTVEQIADDLGYSTRTIRGDKYAATEAIRNRLLGDQDS